MIADIRARFTRFTRDAKADTKQAIICSTQDTLIIDGQAHGTNDYDTTTMWTTLSKVQKRIRHFASRKLTYGMQPSSTNISAEEDSDNDTTTDSAGTNIDEGTDHKCGSQVKNAAGTQQEPSSYRCSFDSVTACLDNVKKCIKENVAKWRAGKSQSTMNKFNGTGQNF